MSEDAPCKTLRSLAHDRELAAALGNMVIAWAYADKLLIGTQARILRTNLNLIMAGFYRIPTFESRVKFTRALITEWESRDFDRPAIDKAVKKLSDLSSARNHWIHGDWCATQDPSPKIVIFNHRVDVESADRRKPVKASDVLNHTEAVHRRCSALAQLIDFESLPS